MVKKRTKSQQNPGPLCEVPFEEWREDYEQGRFLTEKHDPNYPFGPGYTTKVSHQLSGSLAADFDTLRRDFDWDHFEDRKFPDGAGTYLGTPKAHFTGSVSHAVSGSSPCDALAVVSGSFKGNHIYPVQRSEVENCDSRYTYNGAVEMSTELPEED